MSPDQKSAERKAEFRLSIPSLDVSVNLVHETLSQTTAVHTAQTRLHQTVHDSLLVDTVGRVRSNGAQRFACIAASAYRISKNKKRKVSLTY